MKDLNYKGYAGSVDFSVEDGVLFGKLLHISDLVSYEAVTVTDLVKEFHSAIDDYLADCEQQKKSPDKPFKGAFNVRVKPELHRELVSFAGAKECSLNEYVATVLSCHKHVELAEKIEAPSGSDFVFVSAVSAKGAVGMRTFRRVENEALPVESSHKGSAAFLWASPMEPRH